jgi:hypothetical protein
MFTLRRFQHDRRLIAALLLACALFARIAVPPGYMIGSTAPGGMPVIEICTGQGAMTVAMPGMSPTGDHRSEHQATDHPCSFAAAAAAVDLVTAIHPLTSALPVLVLPGLAPGFSRPGLGLAAPPPPKTGPPILR